MGNTEVHGILDGFVRNRLKYDPTISASLVRFLTKKTGSNVLAGIGGKLKTLEDKLKKEIKKLATLVRSVDVAATLGVKMDAKAINKSDDPNRKQLLSRSQAG